MDLGFILSKLFMMFLAMGAAFIAVKCGLWGVKGNQALSKAVIYIFNPATALVSAISGDRPYTTAEVLQFTAIAWACYAFLVLTSYLIPLILRVPKKTKKIYQLMYVLSNVGFYGIPVVQALFGTQAVLLVIIFALPFQVMSYTFGVAMVAPNKKDSRISLKMFLHPMIITSTIGYVLYLLKVQFPVFIVDGLDFLNKATSPVAMAVAGGTLAFAPIKKVFLDWRQYALAVIKMIVAPLILLFILRQIFPVGGANDTIVGVAVILMSMPTAAVCTMLASQYDNDFETTSCGVFLTTLLSAATIPFLMWILSVL